MRLYGPDWSAVAYAPPGRSGSAGATVGVDVSGSGSKQEDGQPPTVTHGVDVGPHNVGLAGAGYTRSGSTWAHPTYGTLTPSGTVTTTSNGQVIEGLDIAGMVKVQHHDVTIRRCIVRAGNYAVDGTRGFSTMAEGLTIEDSDIAGYSGKAVIPDARMYRCRVTGGIDGLYTDWSGATMYVEECWIYGLANAEGTHNDGIQFRKGERLEVVRSRIEGLWQTQTSAILAQAKSGPIGSVIVEDSMLSGGNFTIYATEPTYSIGSVTITGNYFARDSWGFGHFSGRSGAWSDNWSVGVTSGGTGVYPVVVDPGDRVAI